MSLQSAQSAQTVTESHELIDAECIDKISVKEEKVVI